MRFVRLACLCLLASVASALPVRAAAGERILKFDSAITVHKDASMTVIETITVNATGKKIRRGIYRDFPVRYVGRDFRRVVVPFDIIRVERNGKPEPYHTKREGNYERIYIGSESRRVESGVHTYALTYKTGRQLGFFAKHDELYWNVTGNEWEFEIDEVTASVALPDGVPDRSIRHEAYTGAEGAKGREYESSVDAAGRAVFKTTRPLALNEGLTIVVTWPKGFVAEPTFEQKLDYFFRDNGIVVAALIGMLVTLAYFTVAWVNVGLDPEKGTIIPLFDAPEGLCPASVRYILRMGFDKACFAAAVISAGVKRCLTIEDDDGDYVLQSAGDADTSALSRGEKKVLHKLLRGGGSIELDNSNHQKFQSAIKGLKEVLADEYEGQLFFSNRKWFMPGVVLSVLTIAAVGLTAVLIEGNPAVAFLCVWLTGWSFGTFFLVRQVIATWAAVRGQKTAFSKAGSVGGALFITVFAVPFCVAEVVVLGILATMTSLWLLPILVLIGLVNVLFCRLLKRPTPEGRQIMDQIEGLRMYLGTAEQDQLSAMQSPERTPELFEKFLPYALALGVENEWAESFREVLERAAQAEGGYQPAWYHGAAWSTVGAVSFASSFSGSFHSALSSASTAPGSSSGSGGGGSSGGGGGGGGGGGW